MNPHHLLCIGECMMELSPVEGGLFRPAFAGDTFVTAWYARELLPKTTPVELMTALGNDSFSATLLGFLHEAGIGIASVQIVPGRNIGLSMITIDEYGDRVLQHWRDTSAARKLAADPARLRSTMARADYIHFSGITMAILSAEDRETLLAELRRARAAGATVCFDPNIRPELWESRDALRTVLAEAARASSVVLTALDEEQAHLGVLSAEDSIARYQAIGVETVVVKRGPEGSMLLAGGRIQSIPAAPAPWVVDRTAAGDSFNGAFIARLMEGDTAERAARKASIVTAEVIAQKGALVRVSMRAGDR